LSLGVGVFTQSLEIFLAEIPLPASAFALSLSDSRSFPEWHFGSGEAIANKLSTDEISSRNPLSESSYSIALHKNKRNI
jgi:hypothetical protein